MCLQLRSVSEIEFMKLSRNVLKTNLKCTQSPHMNTTSWKKMTMCCENEYSENFVNTQTEDIEANTDDIALIGGKVAVKSSS